MIAVIADDISGAAELAGAALRRGLRAEVQTVFDPRTDAHVICVDTDTRSMPALAAARAAGEAARRVVESRPDWIYKKCDSVLRGHVLAELRAIMAAAGHARAMLIPANPSRGRVVRGGHLFVDGRPLHATAFARDPEHPRTTSRMAELLGGDLDDVAAPDAECEADLARHAASVDDGTLAAGGVDFFEALLAQRGFAPAAGAAGSAAKGTVTAGPSAVGTAAAGRLSAESGAVRSPPVTLAICGSAAAWGRRQREAGERNIPAFGLPHDVPEITGAFRSSRRVLIGIGDGPATRGAEPSVLVGRLARTAAEVLRGVSVERILLEGGATAAAVVREMGWTRLRACEAAAPGIGTLRPFEAAVPILSIKPGSYDWPAELWR